MSRRRWVLVACLLPALLAGRPAEASAQLRCDPCVIGVVVDGPWEQNDAILSTLQQEVLALLGENRVSFPASKRREGNWTLAASRAAIDALLADADVDIVVAAGPIASTDLVGRSTPLAKPVIATFLPSPVAQALPVTLDDDQDRVSGVPNLTYVIFSGTPASSFRRFAEVAPYSHLAVLVMAELVSAAPGISSVPSTYPDATVSIVPVGASVDQALATMPAGVDAVYVTPLTHLPADEFRHLVSELIARKLPSFSSWGRSEVEAGLLTSTFADADIQRLGRRIAIDIERLIAGEDASTLPVEFVRGERLSLNMATALAVEAYPSWDIYTEAELINAADANVVRRLDLATVAREAEAASLALAAARQSVAAAEAGWEQARSVLRPQLSVSLAGQLIDEDRAEASFGSMPQGALVAGASASQLIFSDQARSGIDVSRARTSAAEYSRDQVRLDAVLDAVVAYLNVLRTMTFEEIQRENLITTRSHLELAESRQRLGVARQQEVLRWQSQLATNRRDVIAANARRNQAEIALNQLLNRPLEEPFEAVDAGLADTSLRTTAETLDPFVDNPFAFDLFRDFMAAEALSAAPELRQIDAAIEIQRRVQTTARRRQWLPTIGLQADLTSVDTWGAGTSFAIPIALPGSLPRPNRFNWTLGIRASLPVFEGGRRKADVAQASLELARLGIQRDATADLVEQRVRATLHAAGASHAAIQLTQDAATAAEANLTLVMEAYSRGAVSVTELIDAQSAQLTAELLAANAVHDYLIDLMSAQRAVGRFDFFTDDAVHQDFLTRLRRYFLDAGYPLR